MPVGDTVQGIVAVVLQVGQGAKMRLDQTRKRRVIEALPAHGEHVENRVGHLPAVEEAAGARALQPGGDRAKGHHRVDPALLPGRELLFRRDDLALDIGQGQVDGRQRPGKHQRTQGGGLEPNPAPPQVGNRRDLGARQEHVRPGGDVEDQDRAQGGAPGARQQQLLQGQASGIEGALRQRLGRSAERRGGVQFDPLRQPAQLRGERQGLVTDPGIDADP